MRAVPRPSSMSSAEVAASTSSAVESAPPETMSTTGARSSSSARPLGRSNLWREVAYLRETLGIVVSPDMYCVHWQFSVTDGPERGT